MRGSRRYAYRPTQPSPKGIRGGKRMSLRGRPILVVYGHIDLFVLELQDAFDRAGADTVIARTPADALRHLRRFDAVVINHVQGLDAGTRELVETFAGTPVL